MKIKYLGTGASEGIPAPFCCCEICANARKKGGREIRHRTSCLIDGNLLIDLSPDTFSQAASYALDLSALSLLLITHTHPDHFYIYELINAVLPDIKRANEKKLNLACSQGVYDEILHRLKKEQADMLLQSLEITILQPFEATELCGYTVTPLPARHSTVMPFIYIIEKDGKRLLYGNDTGFFFEEVWDRISGVKFDMVSLDCTNLTDNATPVHMSIEDDITVKKRFFQQKNLNPGTRIYATHFSHFANLTHYQIDERLRLNGIIASYDGMEVEI